jgi:hypothetical protein
MELAGADMIMGYVQDGLATIGPLQFNKCLPLLVHAASRVNIFQRVTLPGPRIVIASNNDQRLDLFDEPFCELKPCFADASDLAYSACKRPIQLSV